jgi:hypothetical protein
VDLGQQFGFFMIHHKLSIINLGVSINKSGTQNTAVIEIILPLFILANMAQIFTHTKSKK